MYNMCVIRCTNCFWFFLLLVLSDALSGCSKLLFLFHFIYEKNKISKETNGCFTQMFYSTISVLDVLKFIETVYTVYTYEVEGVLYFIFTLNPLVTE